MKRASKDELKKTAGGMLRLIVLAHGLFYLDNYLYCVVGAKVA